MSPRKHCLASIVAVKIRIVKILNIFQPLMIAFFSPFMHPLPSLQMNSKPFWSACPLIASWMCLSLPSSGQSTCHSRSGTRSWSPALPRSWEKPRRLSGNSSPWANAALNNLTSVYPERGNPQWYSSWKQPQWVRKKLIVSLLVQAKHAGKSTVISLERPQWGIR